MNCITNEFYCEGVNCAPVDVLARTLYGEARGEGLAGVEAVACVIINRIKRSLENEGKYWWGNDVVGVCQKPYQFSCWNENDPNRAKLLMVNEGDKTFAMCKRVARRAICGYLKDVTDGSTHYHTKAVNPKWSLDKAPEVVIGNHLFYKL